MKVASESVALLLFGYLLSLVEGKTKCYECDSRKHVMCKTTFGYTDQQAEHSGIITTCGEGQVCRKMVFTDFSGSITVRQCANSVIDGCRKYRKDESQVCDCSGNFCNGQDVTTRASVFLIPLMILSKLFV